MRIVILASSAFSETACALAVRMSELGHVPVGALALRSLNRQTMRRKLAQWGMREVASYARAKLIPNRNNGPVQTRNPYLEPLLTCANRTFRSLRDAAFFYDFQAVVCNNQNAERSIARLQEWSPDLILFTGGDILRKPLLNVPRLGVLNAHLGLLPEIRGMSSPEWSLLKNVPVGVTIHYIDQGIDTGPILQRCEFPDAARSASLSDLRHRLIAFGVEKMAEVVTSLDRGAISAVSQCSPGQDHQLFVMHEWLRLRAAERLATSRMPAALEQVEQVSR